MRGTITSCRAAKGITLSLILCFVLGVVGGCTKSPAGEPSTPAVAIAAPPAIEAIQKQVSAVHDGVQVVGLHKLREGAYLVITDKPAMEYGGPYQLLRLESGDWMLSLQMTFGDKYVKVTP